MKAKNKAIVIMIFSAFTFSAMQIVVKILPQIPLMEKVFFRNLLSVIMAVYFIKRKKLSFFGKKENRKVLIYRYLFGFSGVVLFFYSTSHMLAANAAMLNKLSPVFIILLAHFFLKEKINKIKITVLAISVVGAVFVIKPSFSLSFFPAVMGFFSSILSGAAYICITFIDNKESIYTTIFYYSTLSCLSCLPFFLFNFVIPNTYELILLTLLGLLAAIGQLALTFAYNNSPASEISIYDYTNIIFSGILGYVFLSEIPDFYSILGGVLIIVSSCILYLYSKKKT